MSQYEYNDPPRRSLLPLFLIMGGVLAVFALCGGVMFLASGQGKLVDAVGAAGVAPATGDPYPECAAVRAYLKDKFAAADVVSWERRVVFDNPSTDGFVTIDIKWRKPRGPIKRAYFQIDPSNIVASATFPDGD
jgi:hypothetical protein